MATSQPGEVPDDAEVLGADPLLAVGALSGPRLPGHVRRVWMDGRPWTVYERRLPISLGAGRTLIFDSARIVRRVRSFPRHWYRLTETELAEVGRSR